MDCTGDDCICKLGIPKLTKNERIEALEDRLDDADIAAARAIDLLGERIASLEERLTQLDADTGRMGMLLRERIMALEAGRGTLVVDVR